MENKKHDLSNIHQLIHSLCSFDEEYNNLMITYNTFNLQLCKYGMLKTYNYTKLDEETKRLIQKRLEDISDKMSLLSEALEDIRIKQYNAFVKEELERDD